MITIDIHEDSIPVLIEETQRRKNIREEKLAKLNEMIADIESQEAHLSTTKEGLLTKKQIEIDEIAKLDIVLNQ